MRKCEQAAPKINSKTLSCQNKEKANNSLSYRFAAIKLRA